MEKYMEISNMDTYYEQAVKRKFPPSALAKIFLGLAVILSVMVLSIYLSFTIWTWMFPIALIMLGLGIYLIYFLIKNARVEYEYTFVMGELRISRIKGRSKRRTVTYFDVKDIDDIGIYIDPETGKKNVNPSKYTNLLHAAIDDYDPDTYYMVIHDKTRQKPAVLLLTPDERTLQMIKPYLSVPLKKKFFELERKEAAMKKTSSPRTAAPHTETKPEPEAVKAETRSDAKSETKTETKSSAKSETKTETKSGAKSETKTEPKTETRAETRSEKPKATGANGKPQTNQPRQKQGGGQSGGKKKQGGKKKGKR